MIKSVKGTRDLLPEETPLWQQVEATARDIFARYAFREIRTPAFEKTELFVRSIGGETAIVQKEMYTFEDKKGRSLTLRPEATAPVMRAYLEHGLVHKKGVQKLYYIGPMFRYEKPQRGRFRQFYQIGAEVLGIESPAVDAEVIEMLFLFLEQVGLSNLMLRLNSVGCRNCRPEYEQKLVTALSEMVDDLCGDCRRRMETNPLRMFDCKEEGCLARLAQAPMITDHLCSVCKAHFEGVQGFLDEYGIATEIDKTLVRGLDYYTRTAFEISSEHLGAKNEILGGGRYDGLSEQLNGPPLSGFGFAIGLDRLISLIPPARSPQTEIDYYVITLGDQALQRGLLLAQSLRRRGKRVLTDLRARSMKSQLRQADAVKARYALLLGSEEEERGTIQLKEMATGRQEELTQKKLLERIED